MAYRTRIPPHLDPVGEASSWEPPAEPPAYQTDSPGKQLLPVETTCSELGKLIYLLGDLWHVSLHEPSLGDFDAATRDRYTT